MAGSIRRRANAAQPTTPTRTIGKLPIPAPKTRADYRRGLESRSKFVKATLRNIEFLNVAFTDLSRGQDGRDLLGRLGPEGFTDAGEGVRALEGPLLRPDRLQHQDRDQRSELRGPLDAEAAVETGEEARAESVADAGGVRLGALGNRADLQRETVRADDLEALLPLRRDPQADLAQHVGLGPAGLLQQ